MNIICIEDNEADYFFIQKKIKENFPEFNLIKYRYLNDFLQTDESYDLVVTDLRLPDEYGPDVLVKIRHVTGKPIIVLSGVGGHEIPNTILKAIQKAGATVFLSKNHDGFDLLPEALNSFL